LIPLEPCAVECLEAFAIHDPVRMTPNPRTNFVQREAFRKNLWRMFDIFSRHSAIGTKSLMAARHEWLRQIHFGGA
jgi:hypothetical protein